ncbi:hypothetical protein RclHR1_00090022 [Rhizophagus clarus]|uniref:Glycosyltransferase family 2 protein n=1 Tax=Rhizophagus clarus TaxID=94130 RepID=A0A2Z6S2H0_9GLOM|nr:hypothetical protein RclHR1_00090022 [Rhizophagus clarus]GES90500.1 glycosyltransferase family 2 protein [Rhizophagus clarus]
MKEQYKIGLAKILLLLLLVLHEISAVATQSLTINAPNNFQLISQTSYHDGTILLRLSYPSLPLTTTTTTTNCNEPKLFLRLILSDGSIKELSIDVPQIPLENFCNNNSISGSSPIDFIKIHAISSGYIFVTYYCEPSSLNLCGMVIDWNGNILNNKQLGDSCNDRDVVQSFNERFLWLCFVQDSNQLKWQEFSAPDSTGTFNSLSAGTFHNIYNFNSNFTQVFAIENGGYGVGIIEFQDIQMKVYVSFILNNDVKGPFQIYTQITENLPQQIIFKCNIAYESYGYNCVIYYIGSDGQSDVVDIGFFSSGSVSSTIRFTINNELITGTTIWNMLQLHYGGLCLLTENNLNNNINGIIIDNNGIYNKTWDISNNPSLNLTKNVGLFPNNTIWIISKSTNLGENDWTFLTTSLTDFGKPGIYENAYIDSTVPSINTIIPLMSTQKLQIKFKNIIQLSEGNLSIIDLNNNIIRQNVNNNNGNFINLIDNNTVEIDVFETTFNRKDTSYCISVDNGFVKDARVDQELLGIRKGIWNLYTDNNSEETSYLPESFLGSTSAILRLTPAGSTYYTSLSQNGKNQFTKDLISNLSLIIPCNEDLLSIESRYQFDKDSSSQVLLRIFVKKVGRNEVDVDNVSSSQIVKDLDLLIKNKNYNAMSTLSTTSLLDASYGAKSILDLWIRYGYILIGAIIGFVILTIVYFFARKANNKGNNEVIFTFTFIMVDFALDIIFISVHGHDLSWLYLTSILLLIIPMALNLMSTYIIMSKEIKDNNKFAKWWINNSKTALLITLLAGADLESLNCVSSKFFNLTKLSAPLDEKTLHQIFIINTVTILLEDLSQLIVLIIYQVYTIFPAIIPILTLSSCILVLITKSIFSIIYYHKYRKMNIPKKSYDRKIDRLEVTNRDNKQYDTYSDSSPILTPINDDFLRKKPKRSFFGSGQYTYDSKRNSTNSISSTQYASYFPEALRKFSSGDDNNNNNNNSSSSSSNNNDDSSNNSFHSDLAQRIMALNEGNYFGRDERTGEPINNSPPKIRQLSHGKLVGDSIVSVGRNLPDRLNSNDSKRLSNVGIIGNTNSDNKEGERIKEEILMDPYTSSSGRSSTIDRSTIDRTRSTHSETTTTSASIADDVSIDNNNNNNNNNNDNLKKKISSVSLNQQANLDTIIEKSSNVDDDVDGVDESAKEETTS